MMALQLAHKHGAEVYVTSGSDDTISRACPRRQGRLQLQGRKLAQIVAQGDRRHRFVFDGAPASSYPDYGRALNMGARVVDLWLDRRDAIPRQCAGAVSQKHHDHRHQRRQY